MSSDGLLFRLIFVTAMLLVALNAADVLENGWSRWLALACLVFATLVLVTEDVPRLWRRWRRSESEATGD